jgi:hypothetical protein
MKALSFTILLIVLSHSISAQNDNCLDFDGIDDYLLVGDVNDLGVNSFTIEAWINCESTAGIGQFVICKGLTSVGTPSGAGYGIRINNSNMNDVEFIIGGSTSTKNISAISLSTNNWHHIAGVRSGIYMYMYVDGVLVASDSTSTVFNMNTNIPLSIGAIDKGGFSSVAEFMNGRIDEVRIWSIARSQTEINDNKDCAITSPQANLIAVYNMNIGAGTLAADSSGYVNDASFVNNPIWTSSTVAPICSVGMEELEDNSLIVFPNPTSKYIQIIDVPLNGNYQIIDISGKVVKSGNFDHSEIDIKNISKGSYILKLSQDKRILTTRILIQ